MIVCMGATSPLSSSSYRILTPLTPLLLAISARVIPAKKQAALRAATNKRRQTSSVAGNVEQEMIGRAASGGPLRLLKPPPKTDEDAKGKGKK